MTLIEQFFGPDNDLSPEELGESASDLLNTWIERWESGQGPAFLPRAHRGHLYWYGLMDDAPQRRELQELLQHWVGPSCSDIEQNRGALDPADAFDARLADELPNRVTRVEVLPTASQDASRYDQNRKKVRRRLERLVGLLDKRPATEAGTSRSLGATLDDVYLRASQGDLVGANDLVAALERRRLIDAPNTAFVRLRALALAGRHSQVLKSDDLKNLDGQDLPRAFANLIANCWAHENQSLIDSADAVALHQSTPPHVQRALQQADPDAATREHRGLTLLLAEPLTENDLYQSLAASPTAAFHASETTTAPPPPSAPDVEAEARSGAAEVGPTQVSPPPEVESELTDATAFAMWQRGDFGRLVHEVTTCPSEISLDTFSFAIFAARSLASEGAAEAVVSAIESSLGPPSEVVWALPGTAEALREIELRQQQTVGSWQEWFEAARTGVATSTIALEDAIDWDPLPAEVFVDSVLTAEVDHLLPVLGALLGRHRPTLTRAQRARIALPLLEALSVSDRAGRDVRATSYMLVGDILDVDLDGAQRTELLEIIELLIDQQLSAASVAWSLDVLSEVVDALAGPAEGELQNLLNGTLSTYSQLGATLRRQDAEMLSSILEQVGLELPGHIAALFAEAEEDDPLAHLAGKKILIYSLRERSARQAQARLQRLPGVEVTLSHEHAGSTQLAGQVAGAEIVVIVTAAAKHAATDFIEERLTGRKVLVNSAGMTAILHELSQT